jgi:lysyl-tRNA synthetase, class I
MTPDDATNMRALAEQSNAWPFEEARKIVARLKKHPKDEVIFETGYGPSGLPHIGTFGEVARTTMVRHAFRVLTDDTIKTRLIAFSDDMDGLRKVPDNIPNKDLVARHLHKPLTEVPDPFGTHNSFGEHNNARLRAFLDQFGFDYEFMSSTACYTSGRFDAALLKVLAHFEQVMAIMLPSLREERAQSYSPFLPISPRTRAVLQVPVIAHDAKAGTITYEDPDTHEQVTTLVTGGRCKLQWKPDWAMRWVALGVDYEMAGKDLIDSVKLSGEICRALGGVPPEGFNYELFLDENGQKISKSKGNGLTIDEWLRYASPESLSVFMYREPKAAKRLYFDVIPRHVDEYLQHLEAYERQDLKQRLGNPVWHIHGGNPPKADYPVSFNMLLSLVTASNAENADTLWGFIGRYRPGVTRETHPHLASLVGYAINYYRDFVAPTKKPSPARTSEQMLLTNLRNVLSQLSPDSPPEKIQEFVYEVGRHPPFLDKKKKGKDGKPGVSLGWFNMLYQVLLGQEKGPRFGSFAAAYGIDNTLGMIDGALVRSILNTPTFLPPAYRSRLYFDETGNAAKKDPNQRYLSLTGLAIRQDIQDEQVSNKLAALKRQIFGDESVILHRREIVGRKGVFSVLRDENLRAEFDAQLIEMLRAFPLTIFTVSVDKQSLCDQTKGIHGPYFYALVSLLELFVVWLGKNGLYGDVEGEARNDTHDDELFAAFRGFYENGTAVSKEIIQSRLTSHDLKLKSKKANVGALQIADLLAHPAFQIHKLLRSGQAVPENCYSGLAEILKVENTDGVQWIRKWLPEEGNLP